MTTDALLEDMIGAGRDELPPPDRIDAVGQKLRSALAVASVSGVVGVTSVAAQGGTTLLGKGAIAAVGAETAGAGTVATAAATTATVEGAAAAGTAATQVGVGALTAAKGFGLAGAGAWVVKTTAVSVVVAASAVGVRQGLSDPPRRSVDAEGASVAAVVGSPALSVQKESRFEGQGDKWQPVSPPLSPAEGSTEEPSPVVESKGEGRPDASRARGATARRDSRAERVREELSRLAAVNRLLRGDPQQALRLLRETDALAPRALSEERDLLRIEALYRAGREAEGTEAQGRFQQAFPNSPYQGRLRTLRNR